MLVSRCVCAATAFLLAGSFPSQSLARTLQDRQATPPPRTETQPAAPQSVKVFIDCLNVSCDSDFLRTDISFVDHVRDRKDADVHVLITSESTGGGGQKYTVSVMGLVTFDGVDHLVHYVAGAAETPDELRRGLAGAIKLGLVHYVAGTPAGAGLRVSYQKPDGKTAAPSEDPWDYWYMRSILNVYSNGERSTNSTDVYGSVGASRVTDALKIDISANLSYGRGRYTVGEGEPDIINVSRSANLNALAVYSLTPHWSAGLRASASRSTYYNQRLVLRATPAIEYNVYPYSESTRRQFTFNYSAGLRHFRYDEETIFDKTREMRPLQSLLVSGTFKQPWGSFYASVEATQFLNDFSKSRLVFYGSTSVRIFKGFSVRVFGDMSRIRDQIYLAKAGASVDEILLRRRQLATSYSYYLSFGFSYSFGSIHNNIVNTRFESSY